MLRSVLIGHLVVIALSSSPPPWGGPTAGVTAALTVRLPYIGLTVPVWITLNEQYERIEYFDGTMVEEFWKKDDAKPDDPVGHYKVSFVNSNNFTTGRKCMHNGADTTFTYPFPEVKLYDAPVRDTINGIDVMRYDKTADHGGGDINEVISFYWDDNSNAPVRWHVHGRNPVWNSHTDEYIIDYISFQQARRESPDKLPAPCLEPNLTPLPGSGRMASFLRGVLQVMHSGRSTSTTSSDLFETFLQQHGKEYNAEEHALRKGIFEANARLIQEGNTRAGLTMFKGNRFMDMTKDEFLSVRGGKRKGSSKNRRSPEHWKLIEAHSKSEGLSVPAAFDWRTARPDSVGKVKDQSFCGSCWTYGLTEPIESMTAMVTGNLVLLPEQFVVDCTWDNVFSTEGRLGEGVGDNGEANAGCDGGDSDLGALYIVQNYGGIIPAAESYGSYMGINAACKDTTLMTVGAKIYGWVDIAPADLLDAVYHHGPVNVNIMVPDSLVYYHQGVLNDPACKGNKDEIDHAVVMVGFGVDGLAYYQVRNSWSTYWGENGYVRIAQGENDCAVSLDAGYAKVFVSESELVA